MSNVYNNNCKDKGIRKSEFVTKTQFLYKNPINKKSTPRQKFCVKPGLTNTFFLEEKTFLINYPETITFPFPTSGLQNNLNGLQMMTSPPKHCMSSIHVSDFYKNCANFYLGKHDVIPEIFS